MIILMKNWFGLDLILFYPQISIARKNLCLRQFFLILVFYLLSLKFLCNMGIVRIRLYIIIL